MPSDATATTHGSVRNGDAALIAVVEAAATASSGRARDDLIEHRTRVTDVAQALFRITDQAIDRRRDGVPAGKAARSTSWASTATSRSARVLAVECAPAPPAPIEAVIA